MKVKMKETFQSTTDSAVLIDKGITVKVLEDGETYEVNANLGAWLIENSKADAVVKSAEFYGARKEPELKQDDEIYPAMPVAVDEPIMTSDNAPKRGKRGTK